MIPLPKLLNSSLQESRRIRPVDVSISEKITPLSYATIQLADNEDIPSRSFIELFTPNGSAGIFRTKMPSSAYGTASPSIELEHAITELGDYLVRADIEQEMTVRNALVTLFGHYRGSHWQLGSFTATETVLVDTDHDKVLTAILAVLEQQPKYYLTFNFNTTPWTVSLATRGTTVSAEGRLSRNVESAVVTPDESEMCTRVYMKGLPKQTGLDIGYIDADTQSEYGVIEELLEGDDNLTTQQAQRKATTYLNNHKRPRLGISINGSDFSSITGESLDRVSIGKLYRLAVPEYNTTVEENITGITWSSVYQNPEAVTIDLAEEEDPVVSFLKKQAAKSRSSGRSSSRATEKLQESWSQTVQAIGSNGQITAATIAMHINADGSHATIAADHIELNGDAVAASLLAKDLTVGDLSCDGLTVDADLAVLHDEGLSVNGYTMRVRDIDIDGNTMTVYYTDGDSQNFSKATSLSGNWSGGTWTVTASPQGNTISVIPNIHRATGTDYILHEHIGTYSGGTWTDHGEDMKAYLVKNEWEVELNNINAKSSAGPGVITYAKIDVSSIYDAGITFQTGKIVPFIGDAANEAYNGKISTITSNGTYYACAEGYKSRTEGYDNAHYSADQYASATTFTVSVPNEPSIESIWTTQSIPSGGIENDNIRREYERAKADSDNFCIRIQCGSNKKTYYCTP